MRSSHRMRFINIGFVMVLVTSLPFILFCILKLFGFDDATSADTTVEGSSYEFSDTSTSEDDFACRVDITSPHFTMSIPAVRCVDVQCGADCTARETIADDTDSQATEEVGEAADATDDVRWYQGANVYDFVHWAAIVSFAVTISIIGVMSSVSSRFATERQSVRLKTGGDIASLFFFSAVSGVLLLMLCIGGFLGGSLFPQFDGGIKNFGFNSWSGLDFRGPEWGKLAVWAYISGFYERFVPDLFEKILDKGQNGIDTEGDAASS